MYRENTKEIVIGQSDDWWKSSGGDPVYDEYKDRKYRRDG